METRRRRILFAVCLAALVSEGLPLPAPVPPLPPLEQTSGLVASFGEYRPDHLHPGIDLSTGGRDGLPVHAILDGEIYRLKVEWRGYGRALYLRHGDGRISVYAHLERFEDSSLGLEKRVAEAKLRTGARYPGDIFLEPPVPVLRGAVVAYSGESGAGLPHLHFEIRKSDQEPADPLAGGWLPGGEMRPIFEAVRLVADAPRTWIEGGRSFEVPLSPGPDGTYAPPGPIGLTGPFLPQARVHSEDRSGHRLGVKGLTVRWDGRTVYRFRLESFSFSEYPAVGLLLDHSESHTSPPTFCYWLARLPGNRLGLTESPEEPWPAPVPGRHLLEVEALGVFGEIARARIPIVVVPTARVRWAEEAASASGRFAVRIDEEPGPDPGSESLQYEAFPDGRKLTCGGRESLPNRESCSFELPAGALGITASLFQGSVLQDRATLILHRTFSPSTPPELRILPSRRFVDVRLKVPKGAAGSPSTIWIRKGEAWESADLVQEGANILRGTVASETWSTAEGMELGWASDSDAPRTQTEIHPQSGDPNRPLILEAGSARLAIPTGAFYDATPVRGETPAPAPSPPPHLVPIGAPARFLPAGLPLSHKGQLSLAIPPSETHPERLGIYRHDSARQVWDYMGGERKGDQLVLAVGRLDTFALFRDDLPPRIIGVEPSGPISRRAKGPPVRVRVEDEGTGLSFDGVHLLLDGRELETEFDPDRNWSVAPLPGSLSPGSHGMKVWAVDRAGNRSPVATFKLAVQ